MEPRSENGDLRAVLVPKSKSILNRLLIIESFKSNPSLDFDSSSEDVLYLKAALEKLNHTNEFFVGLGGTSLRFLALRLSRNLGVWKIRGESRLFQRPQGELIELLSQLGVKATLGPSEVVLEVNRPWNLEREIRVSAAESSQFLSSVVLNAWQLPSDLIIHVSTLELSRGYWEMTLSLCRRLGMSISIEEQDQTELLLRIAPSVVTKDRMSDLVEADMSSAAALAASAALAGDLVLKAVPESSLQPDFIFLEIFQRLGIGIERMTRDEVRILKSQVIAPIECNLSQAPDLFPILSVMVSAAQGSSCLFGAPHLAHKESNRITKTSELLSLMGVRNEVRKDGLVIWGSDRPQKQLRHFDVAKDHRLVMACRLAQILGHNIQPSETKSLSKSFPDFWSLTEGMKRDEVL